MPKKCKRELKDLQADLKYHKIYHTKKAKTEDEEKTIFHAKESEQKRRIFMFQTSSLNHSSKDDC